MRQGEQAAVLAEMLKRGAVAPQVSLTLEVEGGMVRVSQADVIWLEASDHYLVVHTLADKHVIRKSLSDFCGALPEAVFQRVHRSAVVNIHKVTALHRNVMGGATLTLVDGSQVQVSRRRLASVKQALHNAASSG